MKRILVTSAIILATIFIIYEAFIVIDNHAKELQHEADLNKLNAWQEHHQLEEQEKDQLIQQTEAFMNHQSYDSAFATIVYALQLDSTEKKFRFELGKLLNETQNYEEAIHQYTKAIHFSQTIYTEALLGRAQAYLNFNQAHEAIADLKAAVETNGDYYFDLGNAYDQLGYPDSASECFRYLSAKYPEIEEYKELLQQEEKKISAVH